MVYHDQRSHMLNKNAVNDFGDTPLHIAAKWGFCECYFIKNDVRSSVIQIFSGGEIVYCIKCHIDLIIMSSFLSDAIVELLLQNGADPQIRNRKNLIPVQLAHNVKVAKLLHKAVEVPVKFPSAATTAKQPMERRVSRSRLGKSKGMVKQGNTPVTKQPMGRWVSSCLNKQLQC